MYRRHIANAACLFGLLSPAARAQSTKAELFGVVRDPSHLPLAGARIEVVLTNAASAWVAESGKDGAYHVFGLPAGAYQVTVAKVGFTTLRRAGVTLRAGGRTQLELHLSLGEVAESVEVRAAAPMLETSRGTASFVVEQRKIVTLPLDGRNFIPLIALAPGTALPPGSVLPRINGSRPRTSEYIYDGISVLQPEPGQAAYYPVVDAIEEFRVEINSYSAEYGRSNGGVIMVNQKAGTNSFHGTLFEFFRNEALNARNLFANSQTNPRFRRNQFGWVLGGPIRKRRTFFFLDYQGTRLDTGTVRTSTIPASAQKGGVFTTAVFDPLTTARTDAGCSREAFPNATIPRARFDRAASAVLDRYPAPNVFSNGNNYRRIGNDTTAQDQFDARVDHLFRARHRLFARFARLRDDSTPATPLPDGSGNLTSGVTGITATRAASLVAEHTWTIAPNALNQLRFGCVRRAIARRSGAIGGSAGEVTLIPNLPVTSFSNTLPIYDLAGFQQLGPPANGNADLSTSVTQFIDNYSRMRGRHSLKAGADLRLEHIDVLQPPSPAGNFQFTSIFTSGLTAAGTPVAGAGESFASFLLGQVTKFSIDVQPQTIRPRAKIAEFFLQDDWRATSRLQLNLGVRYTLNFPSTVVANQGAVFNLKTQQLDFLGQDGYPRTARDLEKTDFGPRIGIACKLTDSLVVRSGYGLTWIEQAGITTPFTTPLFPFTQTLGEQTLDNINPAFVLSQGPRVRLQPPNKDSGLGQGVFATQRTNGSGYAQQWNWTVQKTFAENWSVEAGYLGSKLTRLGVPDVNLNQLTAAQLAMRAQLTAQAPNPFAGQIPANASLNGAAIARGQLLRPYPRFTTVALYRNNVGHSTYHSLQARAGKRFSRGLTFTAAYTFSRLIDDAGSVFNAAILTGPAVSYNAADSFNRRLEKDVSDGNIPHALATGFIYELPFGGWRIGGIWRVQSGSPVPVTQATNFNAFAGFGMQRPNRVQDPSLPATARSTARWFNTAAFTGAPQFTLGTSSRNPVSGPGYTTFDAMVGKTFPVGERLRAEFRAEVFNSTNTPPLGNPNSSFGSAAFGSITTALDPRVFEVVMKLTF